MAKKQVEVMKCAHCQEELSVGARSCDSCGHYVVNDEALAVMVSQINKELFDHGVHIFKVGEGDESSASLQRISCGSLAIDKVLGGGIPCGARVELAGPDQAGKSTFAMHLATEVQKKGGKVLYIDVEQTFNPTYATAIGVDVDELLMCKPSTGTLALEVLLKTLPYVQLIILDSVAACAPNAELLKETKKDAKTGEIIDAQSMGGLARMMSAFQPKLMKAYTSNPDCITLFINQIRENLDVYSGEKYAYPGGRAIRHMYTARFLLDTSGAKSSKIVDSDGTYIGRRSKFTINKWKYGFARESVNIEIREHGIDKINDIMTVGHELGILTKSGAWWYYKEHKFQGEDNLRATLTEDEDLRLLIEGDIRNVIENKEAEDE